MMRFLLKLVLLTVAMLAAAISSSAFAADIGVVFMHGKWGTPGAKSPIGPIAAALERSGYLVETPDMPWSRSRSYDRDIAASLLEIDAAVAKLKGKGAQRVVVGGQSMGANAALIYGSQREGLAGILVIAPGHTPELASFKNGLAADIARAQTLITEGKGDAREQFNDINQGKSQKVTATPKIYFSWFDPDGGAVMPKSATLLKPGTPLFWAIGKEDSMAARGEGYAFAKAPANPKSAFRIVEGDHIETPTRAAAEAVAWLKAL